MFWPLVMIDIVLAVVAVGDLITLPRSKAISCRTAGRADRVAGQAASRDADRHQLVAAGGFAVAARRRSGHDAGRAGTIRSCGSEPRSRATLHYDLRPQRRGAFAMSLVYLRLHSQLGLWQRLLKLPIPAAIARLSRHEAARRVRGAGADQPAEPDGRAADAADRPGQRIRAAARLHARRQLQAHRLAEHRAATTS